MKEKKRLNTSKSMWLASIVLFAVVAASMLFSTYYMNLSVQAEEEAQNRRTIYKELGENLADASDYLTAQVRYFAVTGNVEHLYQYWEEIFVTKRREQALEAFESSSSPKEERELLERAKEYSDLLVETETRSMKLVLQAEGIEKVDDEKLQAYIDHVLSYEGEEDELSPLQMREKAVEILYDEDYEAYKTKIMTPIDEFNVLMNQRLDREVEERKRGTRIATVMQVMLALAALCAIGLLMQLMKRMYSIRQEKQEAELASQAKSVFLAQMSHELRTPLNAVGGYTFLLEQTVITEKQREYLKGIRYSSEGLLELINRILDFSKMESGSFEAEQTAFSLEQLVKETEAVFHGQAVKKGLEFYAEIDKEVPDYLYGDPLRLRQVLVNLLGNAFKFTEKGSVALTVKLQEKGEESCVLVFAVKDTGIGIEEAAKEKIFKPFVQSDASVTRKYGGTGLGLSICSDLVAMLGDQSHRLEVESVYHKGSTFYFTMDFPYADKKPEQIESKPEKLPSFSGETVFVVDDSEINIRVQREILSACGLQVLTATSGVQALELLQQEKEVRIIFMDIRMPQMDGYETARRIRQLEQYQATPIVALTADAVEEVQTAVSEAGMNGCLLKPIQQAALWAVLREFLAESHKADDIMEQFRILHGQDKETLTQLLKEGEYKKAEELVHKLKGVTGNLNCTGLYESCRRLQQELQQRKADSFLEFVRQWEFVMGETPIKAEAVCEQQETEEIEEKDIVVSHEEQEDLEKIRFLCKSHDTEAVVFLEERWSMIERLFSQVEGERLKRAMLTYQFREMEQIISGFMEKQA